MLYKSVQCTCYFCVLGPENTPHPIHVRHFCVSPPPPPPPPGSADTDMIVILLEFMPQFKLWNDRFRIWCIFGTGVNRKVIGERLGKALSLARRQLPFPSFTLSVDVTILHTSSTTQRTSCMLFGCLVLYTKKLAGCSNC